MSLVIQSNKITGDKLANLLKSLSTHFNYLIVSDWQDICFVKFNPEHPAISNSYTGRAFGENAELRWRRDQDNNEFICRWISDDGSCPDGDGWKPLPQEELSQLTSGEKMGYLLWGELLREDDKDFWYQARIPKKLEYPIDKNIASKWKNKNDKTPLMLYVREYKLNARTMFDRFIGLDRYGEEM